MIHLYGLIYLIIYWICGLSFLPHCLVKEVNKQLNPSHTIQLVSSRWRFGKEVVNKHLYTYIDVVDTKKPNKKKKGLTSEVLQDERFKSLFSNEDFEVYENSLEYRALHPLAAPVQQSLVKEHFEPFMVEDEDQSDSDASEEHQSSADELTDDKNRDRKKNRAPRLYEVKDERHAEAFRNSKSLAKEDALPLEERVKALENNKSTNGFNKVKAGPGGSREISFISRSKGKYKEDEYDDDNPRAKRRGIQSLGLKSDRSGFRGQGGRGGGRGRGGGGRGRGGGGRGRGRGRGRR